MVYTVSIEASPKLKESFKDINLAKLKDRGSSITVLFM